MFVPPIAATGSLSTSDVYIAVAMQLRGGRRCLVIARIVMSTKIARLYSHMIFFFCSGYLKDSLMYTMCTLICMLDDTINLKTQMQECGSLVPRRSPHSFVQCSHVT